MLLMIRASCSSGGGSGETDSSTQPDDIVTMDSDDLDDALKEDGTDVTADEGDTDVEPPPFNIGYVSDAGLAACSTADLNAWVDFDIRDYYIYHDQVPQLNLADYTDPSRLI